MAIKKLKIKIIVLSILIGFVVFPSVVLGGTFVSSLIQGKTVEQAVVILAEQIDFLIGRVEILETKQSKTELWQEKEDACNKARDYLSKNMFSNYELYLNEILQKEQEIIEIRNKIDIPECQDYEKHREVELNNLMNEQLKDDRGSKIYIERGQMINVIINEREEMYYIVNQQNINNECVYDTKENRQLYLEKLELELQNFFSIKEEYLLLKQQCDDLNVQ